MLKNIKKYSVAALAALVIVGCGGDSSPSELNKLENNGKAATIQGLRSLGDSANTDNLSNTKIRSSTDSLSSSQQDGGDGDNMCQSGTMDFTTANNQQTISFNANNCNDGYSTINGSARIEMYADGEGGGFFEVLTDLTVEDDYFSLFAKKGSNLKINLDGSNMSLAASFQADINGEVFSASNLSVIATESNYGSSFYIGSGEMIIGEYYFKVDPIHNASMTPIKMDDNGFVSGVIKLLDGAGHKIEIAVVSQSEIAFKVDENGDGTFSDNEILVENIDDALDFIDSEATETSSEGTELPSKS